MPLTRRKVTLHMLRQRGEEKDRLSLSPLVSDTFKALYRTLIQNLWVPSSVLISHRSLQRTSLSVGIVRDHQSPLPCDLCPKVIKHTIIGIRCNFLMTEVLEGMELAGELPAWNDLTL